MSHWNKLRPNAIWRNEAYLLLVIILMAGNPTIRR